MQTVASRLYRLDVTRSIARKYAGNERTARRARSAPSAVAVGGMRRHGVRGLFVTCQHCGHERAVNMDDWPDDTTVPSFGPRMRCSRCGKLGATAVPNWIERADRLPGGARR